MKVKDLQPFARQHGLDQLIVVAFAEGQTHVLTYGETTRENKEQAAAGGDAIRRALGFPDGPLDEDFRVAGLEPRGLER